ncbi:Sodium- and chloride-dependent glycine transporter 2 [Nymphon striatum]|nr:Sodium- and chloride-dependent glycine transporter 2 [Nymphon striatum]
MPALPPVILFNFKSTHVFHFEVKTSIENTVVRIASCRKSDESRILILLFCDKYELIDHPGDGLVALTTGNMKPIAIKDENKERGNWSNKMEFLLSCLSYAVGLGNIWRFPYLCYRNGGGAFLIPYVVMLIFTGIPLFFLELSFGQYASQGPITVWRISPLFQGIGYAMFLVSTLVGIYYNMILAWALFYLGSSFTSKLPWSSCDNWWNTKEKIEGVTQLFECNFVLDISTGIHDLGTIRWELSLCLLASWIIVFCCLSKGVKSVGKVVYFTALFPYMVLFILMIRGLTLNGAMKGIIFYLTPQWERLLDAKVWGDAAVQIFFSLSPCWGGLITLASYNRFHNNCYRDAITVAFSNCLTSFFAGFVIFGIIGFMAHELGTDVDKVAKQGASLAFVAYPEAVARLPISPLWSFLFFLMLLTLGMGTQFTIVETIVTTITDTFPEKLRQRKPFVLAAVCLGCFTVGLVLCSQGGMYVLQLMDNYCATFSALLIGLCELIVIGWVYGIDKFLDDIKVMLGKYPYHYRYWWVMWKYITPTFILGILLFTWIDFEPTKYGDIEFPIYADAIGWTLSMLPVSMIPIVACITIYKSKLKGTILQKIKALAAPSKEWGPALKVHINETMKQYHGDSQVPLAGKYNNDGDSGSENTDTPENISVSMYRPHPDILEEDESGLQFLMNKETGL